VDQANRAMIVQFLGCAQLCGCAVSAHWFDNVSKDEVIDLPISALPHRAEAEEIEDWQFQLWLGLRAIASVTKNSLPVPPGIVAETLSLWRVNLRQTSPYPDTTEHRVNVTMIDWLEKCSREGRLLPHNEPVWLAVGFPR
jgi:hypothetical protein